MSPELHISPKTLAVRTNGKFSPTDRGHLAHELVRVHEVLKRNSDPKVQFSISEKMKEEHLERRESLCSQLGVPSDERVREKVIQGYNGRLTQFGFPYYKVNIG